MSELNPCPMQKNSRCKTVLLSSFMGKCVFLWNIRWLNCHETYVILVENTIPSASQILISTEIENRMITLHIVMELYFSSGKDDVCFKKKHIGIGEWNIGAGEFTRPSPDPSCSKKSMEACCFRSRSWHGPWFETSLRSHLDGLAADIPRWFEPPLLPSSEDRLFFFPEGIATVELSKCSHKLTSMETKMPRHIKYRHVPTLVSTQFQVWRQNGVMNVFQNEAVQSADCIQPSKSKIGKCHH